MSNPENKFSQRLAELSPEELQAIETDDDPLATALALTRCGLGDVWPLLSGGDCEPKSAMRGKLVELLGVPNSTKMFDEAIARSNAEISRMIIGQSAAGNAPRVDAVTYALPKGRPVTLEEVLESSEAKMQKVILGQNVITEDNGHHELVPTSAVIAGLRLDDGRRIVDTMGSQARRGAALASLCTAPHIQAMAIIEQQRELDMASVRILERASDFASQPVEDMMKQLAPIICPKCGAQHNRRTAQGGVINVGAVVLCYCGEPMRVLVEQFAEWVNMKTCSVDDFKQIDKLKQEMKKAKRALAQRQAANRDAAMRGNR